MELVGICFSNGLTHRTDRVLRPFPTSKVSMNHSLFILLVFLNLCELLSLFKFYTVSFITNCYPSKTEDRVAYVLKIISTRERYIQFYQVLFVLLPDFILGCVLPFLLDVSKP